MRTSSLFASSLLAASAAAKQCQNFTVPVTLDARNAIFNLPTLQSNLDATTLAQNVSSIMGNFTDEALLGYQTINGTYDISVKFCEPDVSNSSNPTVQFLTHGIGFDKTYWDLPFNNFNYSYTDVAVDQYGFSTFAIDRFGIGNSSIADPLNVVQAPAEVSAIYELTTMLRQGTLPNIPKAFTKVVHVGHSFGSAQSYSLALLHPSASDGLILTGFSQNASFAPTTVASWDQKLARLDQPLRFGNISYSAVTSAFAAFGNINNTLTTIESALAQLNITLGEVQGVLQSTDLGDFVAGYDPNDLPHQQDLPTGYLTWDDAGSNQFAFLYPPFFDPEVLQFAESTKQPYTVGELLTFTSNPPVVPAFTGPVLIITGNEDAIYCGGDCSATGDPSLASIPAKSKAAFPQAKAFEAYIQPNTGHAINVHYNSTGAYNVIQQFLDAQGLGSS